MAVQLTGKEKAADRDAYVVNFTPKTGSPVRTYIDAETYLPLKTVTKIDVPQMGSGIEQTTDFFDYKDVDGLKLPMRLKTNSSVQNFTITFAKVEHNVKVDEALFSKPQ